MNEQYKKKFIAIINETREYFEIIEKLENILGVELEKLCNYPCAILDLLEAESNRKWTDEIYYIIYSNSAEDFDVLDLYNKVMELPCTDEEL